MIDPIAQLVSTIKNGYLARKKEIEIPFSKFKKAILDVLVKEGFLEKVEVRGLAPKKTLRIILKYKDKNPVIKEVKLISKPGLRVYQKTSQIKKVLGGLGIRLISTPLGVMTESQAKKKGLGGEVILEVY